MNMNGKGNDSLLKTSKITEWTFNNTGYISLLFGGFLLTGCISAYIIAVARGNVEPFLPLISDAAGSPPQNGLFGTLISFGGMLGIIFMLIRYMVVMEKNQEKSKIVTTLNKCSLPMGVIAMCAVTLITGYPLNFYRNRNVWLSDVGIPHIVGGVAFFSFNILYVAIQSIITLLQKTNRSVTMFRILLCIGCCITFVYHVIMVPAHFGGFPTLNYSNTTIMSTNDSSMVIYPATLGASLKLPIDNSGSYLYSAITEWLLVIMLCCFFFTFYSEAQEYSLLIVVETRCPQVENLHDVLSDLTFGSLTGGDRRESEVRTIFRRDSSCQTPTDGSGVKPFFSTFEKGKYTKRQISSFDMLSGDKLEKLIESHVKKNKANETKGTQNGELKPSTNGTKNLDTLTEMEDSGTTMNGELKTPTSNDTGEPLQNDISSEVGETCRGAIEGTTDRGC